ncbi:hypothetical protein [Gudongella sp. DL1XJH-153]|uniref:hypothetical protein n=1 Tax=Gudongella sp. DL1XJH-153 TaxID=3409804 RepID=UPI003BB536EE
MNEVTQKIIDLDSKTTHMKKKNEELLRKKKFEGQDKVQELERQLLKEFHEEGEKAYREALKETDSTLESIEKIKKEYESHIQNTDEVYSKIKYDLIETLWEDIVAE